MLIAIVAVLHFVTIVSILQIIIMKYGHNNRRFIFHVVCHFDATFRLIQS